MEPNPRLPPEILHTLITTYLSPTTDIVTLRALSLTHSHLLPSTRAVLFHTVRLARHKNDDGIHPYLCHALAALLRRSPHLAGFVQKLIIIEGTVRNSYYGGARLWVSSEEEELPYILRMCAIGSCDLGSNHQQGIGLRHLEVLGFGKTVMNWNSFSPQMQGAFADVFERGCLNSLRIVGLNHFPLHLLRRCSSLRTVCFGWMDICVHNTPHRSGFTTDRKASEHQQCDAPKLSYLDLSFENYETIQGDTLINALVQPTSPIDTSRLEHLVINGERHKDIQKLLLHCGNELEVLEIRNNEYPIPAIPTHIDLRPLSNLQSLSLLVPIIDWEGVVPRPFPWLQHMLSTIRASSLPGTHIQDMVPSLSNSRLQTLHIIFDIDRVELLENINAEEWSTFDDQLVRLLGPSKQNPFRTSEALRIRIYIFSDFDACGYMGQGCAFLKERDSRVKCDNERECGEMRKYLAKFLPVLNTKEGIKRLGVFKSDYIPRLL